MAALVKAVRISQTINNVAKLLTNLSVSSSVRINALPNCARITNYPAAFIHTTSKQMDIMEFFDDPKNWGQQEVKVGRSWRCDELRLKSNEDLHKLWFVLLKERNMLLTMEENAKKHWEIFPNAERIDKVKESMKNLETVVRERNTAYHLLETGENGERPTREVYNQIGMKYVHKMKQWKIPRFMNVKWQQSHTFSYGGKAVTKFLRLLNEKENDKKHKQLCRQYRAARTLFRKFPNLDVEAIKAKYPDIDIEKVRNDPRARGHSVPT